MGVYDTYNGIQLKVGPMDFEDYAMGDTVPIPDSVYLGNEGAVVVLNGVLAATFDRVITKWGDELKPIEIIEELSPIIQVLKIIKEKGLEID